MYYYLTAFFKIHHRVSSHIDTYADTDTHAHTDTHTHAVWSVFWGTGTMVVTVTVSARTGAEFTRKLKGKRP